MCRLYGMRSTHPTRVECQLVEAQNSLIRQAREDARGRVNDEGWGLGVLRDGRLEREREVEPAPRSEEFRRDAARVEAEAVLAHVRRATVGEAAVVNTHPFRHGDSMLAHNGHVGGFDDVRGELLAEMTPEHRRAVRGSTDSEHIFHYLLTLRERHPEARLEDVLARGLRDVAALARDAGTGDEVALNVIWLVGGELVASRRGRSLWCLERDGPRRCVVCGRLHPDPGVLDGDDYAAASLASERITDEGWTEVPEGSVLRVDGEMNVRVRPLAP